MFLLLRWLQEMVVILFETNFETISDHSTEAKPILSVIWSITIKNGQLAVIAMLCFIRRRRCLFTWAWYIQGSSKSVPVVTILSVAKILDLTRLPCNSNGIGITVVTRGLVQLSYFNSKQFSGEICRCLRALWCKIHQFGQIQEKNSWWGMACR